MTSDGTSRPRRRRLATDALSEEQILETAVRIGREEGMEAVTMRRLGRELGTGAASLYVYVSGRDELCQAILERIAASLPLEPPDADRWREQIHALLDALRRALHRHQGLAREALANPPAEEHTLLVGETILALLRVAGVSALDAAWASQLLPVLTMSVALASELDAHLPQDDAAGVDRTAGAFVALPPGRFPHSTALSRELTAGDAGERFRFAVDAFLDGLLARAGQPPNALTEPPRVGLGGALANPRDGTAEEHPRPNPQG